MRLTEIFPSIQGEGPWVGKRCIFVRLHGCNLKCPWCDTKYAWGGMSIPLSCEQVVDGIASSGLSHVVITGGEPMMQLDEVMMLTKYLREDAFAVAVETNGTIEFDENAFDLAVVSPKDLKTAEKWIDRNVVLKIVIYEKNVDEVMNWVRAKGVPADYLYFMPMGTHPQEIIPRTQMILQKMTEFGIDGAISPRYHYFLGVR